MTIRFRVSPGPRIRARVAGRIDPLEAALRNTGTVIQWRIGADGDWQDLIEIDDINATVAVGTVTTLPAGSDATVVNSGSEDDAVFDFGIPRGADGNDGADGADGVVQTIVAGTGIAVDDTDPANPEVSVDADASEIVFTPAGNLAATDVQAAIEELDSEKFAAADVIDEDDMSSDSDTKVPTQQSVKAYVDASAPDASDTAKGLIEIAVQSEMEAGSDTTRAVTPGRQHFHPSAAKAWIAFNGTGTPAVLASYNMDGTTPITDNGTGDYTLNIGADFSSANYASVSMPGSYAMGTNVVNIHVNSATAPAAGALRIGATQQAVGALDLGRISVALFGDQ